MAGKIFINYRRGDDSGNTGRLFDRLQEAFQPEQLFMDVDSVAPGLDFVRVLEEQIGQCDALLAVIGKGWIDARDDTGARRLDNPEDFVRIEIEAALKQDKRVIPVLVGDTRMPRPEELPEAIRPLARRNAVRLSHERFRADAQGLIKALQRALEEVEAFRQANAEVARRAQAEEERKREEAAANARAQAQREAEEQARRDKEQARLSAIAGLSSDQITKAEELANWDFIKASESAQEYRDHLARFPGGVTERFARARLEDLAWAGLGATPGLDQLGDFLAEFPQGTHAKTAADRRAALEQEQAEAEKRRREEEWRRLEVTYLSSAAKTDAIRSESDSASFERAMQRVVAARPDSAGRPFLTAALQQLLRLQPHIYSWILGLALSAVGFAAIGFGVPINEHTLGTTLIVAGTIALTGGLIQIGLAANKATVSWILGLALSAVGFAAIGFGVPINEFTLGTTLIVAGTIALTGGLIQIGLAANKATVSWIMGLALSAVGFAAIGFGVPINEHTLGTMLIVAGTIALTGGLIQIGLAANKATVSWILGLALSAVGFAAIGFGVPINEFTLGTMLVAGTFAAVAGLTLVSARISPSTRPLAWPEK
jgi:TIR domain